MTSKHLGRKGLHLNKAGSTRIAKNINYKLRKFWWSFEHLNESLARFYINIFRPPINCDSLNSNYIVSSKSFAKDEVISTTNLSITDVTKNSVNSKPLITLNLHLMISRIWVLIYIGSRLKTPQESNSHKSILTQSEISLICLWISSKMK